MLGKTPSNTNGFIFVSKSSHAAMWKSSITQEETTSGNPRSSKWDLPQRRCTHASLRVPAKPGSPGEPLSSPGRRGPGSRPATCSSGRLCFDFPGSCPDTVRPASKHPPWFRLRTLSTAARGPGATLLEGSLEMKRASNYSTSRLASFMLWGKYNFAHTHTYMQQKFLPTQNRSSGPCWVRMFAGRTHGGRTRETWAVGSSSPRSSSYGSA